MCGIGLISSGVAIGGYVFSSETVSSGATPQLTSEVAEADHPNIEDLCDALKRRGPDHIGGAIVHIGPSKQHLEVWKCSHLDAAVHGVSRDIYRSECMTMCNAKDVLNQTVESLEPSLNNEAAQPEMTDIGCRAKLHFVGATLQLRGEHPVMQPLEDSVGNLLVYNGEVFGGLVVRGNENDTEVLMGALHGCCGCTCHSSYRVSECQCTDLEHHQSVPKVFSKLRGPWAIIYWQRSRALLSSIRGLDVKNSLKAVSQTLWFGRDAIGRRSLLIHQPSRDDPRLLLTSVAPDVQEDTAGSLKYWEELACGIYSIGYTAMDEGNPRDRLLRGFTSVSHASSVDNEAVQGLRQESLMGWARAHSWEDPWLKTLLAWERRHVVPSKTSLLEHSRSDQLNISQERCAKDATLMAPEDLQKNHKFPFDRQACQIDASDDCAQNDINLQESQEQRTQHKTPVEQVLAALRQAVKRRTLHVQRQWGRSQWNAYQSTSTESNSALKSTAPIAVLFSGGLDSMILAALADQFVDPNCCIDLLNVSFDGDCAPDRITAVTGVAELRDVFPLRRWRLIEIDAELSDLTKNRIHLQSLICPSNTYMDLNIGTALWLAASGEGHVSKAPSSHVTTILNNIMGDDLASGICRQESGLVQGQPATESGEQSTFMPSMKSKECHVRSEAQVLLVGSGADEQCGGYGRHRTKFRLGGWKALEAEMKLDFNRIWKRNLGRDDRCIADQGKEARFPFLDEDVVSTLLGLSLWDVVDLQQPAGIGDKKILRQVAKVLGLKSAALLPKRAIQFGSRIAQQSNRKDFGSNRAANQASAGSACLKNTE